MYKASLFQKRKSGSRNPPYESKCLAQIQPKEIRKMYKHKTGYTANLVSLEFIPFPILLAKMVVIDRSTAHKTFRQYK